MNNNLKKGVSILYDMELNNYLMTRSIGELEKVIAELRQQPTYYEPLKPENRYSIAKDVGRAVLICLALMIMLGGFCGVISCISLGEHADVPDIILRFIYVSFVVFGIGGQICIPIACLIGRAVGKVKSKKEQKIIDNQHIVNCKAKKAELALLEQNNYKESLLLSEEKESIVKRLVESTQKLNGFYEKVGIDSKYRNIVPIGYMNEFIRLGIASKLEGTDGLYYLIMKELRWDQIQCSLEEIVFKLDTLVDNQRAIYYEILDMNSKCDKLVNLARRGVSLAVQQQQTLEQIQHDNAIAAYNMERVRSELEFSNYLNMNSIV